MLVLLGVASARMFILDDGYFPGSPDVHSRQRRDTGPYGAPPAPAYHAPTHHGKVGPVYTFVKTDPQANFKWGVRHRAGVEYGR
jgi:hypothetical protein